MPKILVIIGATLAVALPIFIHLRNVSWSESSLLISLFPAFGLLAFTLLWLHSISGAFENQLRKMFDPAPYDPEGIRSRFDAFVHWTALVILISILLHPLLLLILIEFQVLAIFEGHALEMSLGLIGLILLLTYDVGKALKKYEFFSRHWNKILVVSTIGFLITFFHSFIIGSDLQSGFLRYLWLFYGITATAATLYTYGFKRLTK